MESKKRRLSRDLSFMRSTRFLLKAAEGISEKRLLESLT